MDFITFIKRDQAAQSDPGIRAATSVLLRLEDLPPSSDPRVLAPAIYKLLDPQATKGFQTLMMVYQQLEPAGELPDELRGDPAAFLAAINRIIDLQNNDPAYPWPSPLAQSRFGKRH